MIRLFRSNRLPLGVDITPERVAVVAAVLKGGRPSVVEATAEALPEGPDGELEARASALLRAQLAALRTRERNCVLAAPWSDAVVRAFKLPPGVGRAEAERAAHLEADAVAPWVGSERVVALGPLPQQGGSRLLGVGRLTMLLRLVAIARLAGLRPIAIDAPACVWRRVARDVDAVLDASGPRAALAVFRDAVPSVQLFAPRLVDERLAAQVRVALVEARRDGSADVGRLAVFAPAPRREGLATLLAADDFAIDSLTLNGIDSPPWALAFGLAAWPVALEVAA